MEIPIATDNIPITRDSLNKSKIPAAATKYEITEKEKYLISTHCISSVNGIKTYNFFL